jgi:hypothetical protein
LILVAQLACAPARREVIAGFPPVGNARSAILAIDTPGTPITLCAEDLATAAGTCSASFDPGLNEQIFVILLASTLNDDLLAPGSLELATQGATDSVALSSLGPALGTKRAQYDRTAHALSWVDAALPNEIATLSVRPKACPVLTSSGLWTIADGPHAGVDFATRVSDQAALVSVTINGFTEWMVVDSGGPHALPGPGAVALSRGAGDEVWFSRGGTPFHGVISATAGAGRVSVVEGAPVGAVILAVAAAPGPGTEVFWGDLSGRVFRYDGSAFATIGTLPAPAEVLVWSAPGEAFALESKDPQVVFHVTTTVEQEKLDIVRVVSVTSVPNLGVVAGSDVGALYLRDAGGQWATLGTDRLGYWVLGVAPAPSSVIMLLSDGSLGAYQQGRYCGHLFSFGSVLPTGTIINVGSQIFFAGYDDTTQHVKAGFIEPSP